MGAETLCYLSLHDLSGRIRRGDVSPVEAVEAFLELPLSDEDKHKILWDNCARFYSVAAPAAVA